MKTSELQELLNKQIGFTPKAELMCKVLGLGARQSWYQRVARDSEISDEEIEKLELHFAVSLRENTNVDCIDLNYYPDVYASAGFGCDVLSENIEKMTIAKSQIINYSVNKTYSIVKALGSSMEPYILSNDKLIIEHVEDNTIIDNDVYVFQYEGHTYVKRLIKNVNELVIKSDNPDKETYRTQYISKNEMNNIKIVGKYIGLIREKV